ncbi:HD domain-containing protein [Parvularcula sp. IMCC14364]|uniref:HD domain-containing protein n=1 Tax=Parvularcula sp. IMCC14364 TaxID=3067902 RepID=UPI0027403197|nr:HD domain-containing protein [Parvularcula sp. IMCC14364]
MIEDGEEQLAPGQRILDSARFQEVLSVAVHHMRQPPVDTAHDEAHLQRVISAALEIGIAEKADLDILLAAAALHDVINVPKNHPDRAQASAQAAEAARPILMAAGYANEQLIHIAQAILEHSFSAGHEPSSLESAILQDADRLDSIGAIGVARTAATAARMGSSFYCAADFTGRDRDIDDTRFMVDHFYRKLLLLADRMNTQTAKQMAQKRGRFLKAYLEQLEDELPRFHIETDIS